MNMRQRQELRLAFQMWAFQPGICSCRFFFSVEKKIKCMFHHCLNFHATPQNTTDRERRAFVMIFMAQGVCYNAAQSGGHILVPTIEVKDGEPLVGSGFPVA